MTGEQKPATPRDTGDGELIDQVCDRFEAAWLAGQQPQLEVFLSEVGASLRPRLLSELLLAQWDLCRQCGRKVDVGSYLARFAEDAELVRREYEKWVAEAGDTAGAEANDTNEEQEDSAQRPYPAIPGYEIQQVLGRGGMGVVYKARHLRLKRLVALKMILAGEHAGQEQLSRFRAEAEAVARLQHSNIVQIFDVGEHEGHPFLALEFVEGGDVAHLLRQEALPVRKAAEIVRSVAEGIEYAHECGIVHRDLKPGNLLLVAAGDDSPGNTTLQQTATAARSTTAFTGTESSSSVGRRRGITCKITDFGLAKQLHLADDGPTLTGTVLGTPQYMAPEQAAGSRDVGPAVDIYSMGAILYALLTGRPPLLGDTPVETLMMVQNDEPISPIRLRPRLPRDLDTICLKCLEKQPARRYASATELGEDLDRFLDGRPIIARPIGPLERAVKWARRKPALAAAALFLVIAACLVTWKWLDAIQANRKYGIALSNEVEANRKYDSALYDSRKREAELLLREGLKLCEDGEPDRGLHWLLASLSSFPPKDPNRPIDPDREPFERMIRTNIATWSRQLVRLRYRLEHPHRVTAAAFSLDSRQFATGCHLRTVRIFDTESPQSAVATLSLPPGLEFQRDNGITCLAFSPDGKRIAAGTSGNAVIWDLDTRTVRHKLIHDKVLVTGIAYSPDGSSIVSTSADKKLWLWNANSGVLMKSRQYEHQLTSISFTPDGSTLLTTSGASLPFVEQGMAAGAIRQDGNGFQTGDGDGTLQFWDLASSNLRQTSPRTSLRAAADYARDGRIVAVGPPGGNVVLWNASSGQHHAPAFGNCLVVRLSPDGRWALTGGQNYAQLWRLPWNRAHCVRARDRFYGKDLRCVFSTNRESVVTTVSGKPGGSARVLSAVTGEAVGRPFVHPFNRVRSLVISPDSNTLATGGFRDQVVYGAVHILDASTNRLRFGPLDHTNYIKAVAFNSDGSMLAAGDFHHLVRIWDPASGLQIGEPLRHHDIVQSVDFHPTRNVLAVGTADTRSKQAKLYLWDLDRRELVPKTVGHPSGIGYLLFSPDGKTLCTHSGGEIRLWNTEMLQQIRPPITFEQRFSAAKFHPRRDEIAVGSSDGSVRLWHIRDGDVVLTLPHDSAVRDLEFSADGSRLLVGYADGSARLWDLSTRQQLGPPLVHGHPLIGVTFSSDEQECLTVDAEENVRRWPMPDRVSGDLERLRLEIEVLTMQTMSDKDEVFPLTGPQWQTKQNELLQLQPDGQFSIGRQLPETDWHDACYREAKEDGNWFAARWHLNRLVDIEPGNWLHLLRRAKARSYLEKFEAADADYAKASELVGAASARDPILDWHYQCLLECRRRQAWQVWLWYCERVLEVDPENSDLRSERDGVLDELKNAPSK